jgi:alpha-galactosidase
VDYLKYDWCNTGTRNAEEAYALMSDALRSTGRDIVFSLCEWGNNKPWLWAQKIGNLWRTTGDITDKWEGKYGYSWGVLNILDMNEPLWPYARPGNWNDPDMLEVGNPGLNETQSRSHFSLWAMMAAPLIAGNDVANMTPEIRNILLNKEVIAVNQDRLGIQGRRVWREDDREVWVKPLSEGRRAVLLFNRGEQPQRISFDWEQLGYPKKLEAKVRDLWTHRDIPARSGTYETTVQAHGVQMLVLQP